MGTAGAVAASVLLGAHIVRVHDAAEMVEVVRVCDAIVAREGRPDRSTARWPSSLATGVGWMDVLDILLVAFIIYELLRSSVAPTRSRSPWGCWSWCSSTGPRRSSTSRPSTGCCATSCPVLMFGIIVIFQSEIRKVARPPRPTPRFVGSAAKRQKAEVIDEVVLAATTLSSQRTGAILALEREIGLRSYIETGINLDARADLRPARQHLPSRHPAARRGGDRPGQPGGRRRVLPAPHRQPAS